MVSELRKLGEAGRSLREPQNLRLLWKAAVAWCAQCYPWMSTINSIDGFVYTPSGEEAQKLEAEQRKGFFDDTALITDWF